MSKYHLYFASCDSEGGVVHYYMDGKHFEFIDEFRCDRPMYLEVLHGKMNVLLRQPFYDNAFSALLECSIAKDGSLTFAKEMTSTEGIVACHLCTFKDQIYVTNYLSGNVFNTAGKKDTHEGSGCNLPRQDSPHPHFIAPSPDKKCLLCTDLGLDAVFLYDENLEVLDVSHVPSGHGPRHLACSEDKKFIFCANELASTVTVFKYENCKLYPIQTVKVLKSTQDSTVAAIRVSGNYVYVSNRGDDSISCLYWDGAQLKLLSVTPCGGACPRDFLIVDDKLICTNEDSDTVSVFEVREDQLTDLGIRLHISHPICVVACEYNESA